MASKIDQLNRFNRNIFDLTSTLHPRFAISTSKISRLEKEKDKERGIHLREIRQRSMNIKKSQISNSNQIFNFNFNFNFNQNPDTVESISPLSRNKISKLMLSSLHSQYVVNENSKLKHRFKSLCLFNKNRKSFVKNKHLIMTQRQLEDFNHRILSPYLPLRDPVQIHENELNILQIFKSVNLTCYILSFHKSIPLKMKFINLKKVEMIVYASRIYKNPNRYNFHEKLDLFGKYPEIKIKVGERNNNVFTSAKIYVTFQSDNYEGPLKFYVAFGKNIFQKETISSMKNFNLNIVENKYNDQLLKDQSNYELYQPFNFDKYMNSDETLKINLKERDLNNRKNPNSIYLKTINKTMGLNNLRELRIKMSKIVREKTEKSQIIMKTILANKWKLINRKVE